MYHVHVDNRQHLFHITCSFVLVKTYVYENARICHILPLKSHKFSTNDFQLYVE